MVSGYWFLVSGNL